MIAGEEYKASILVPVHGLVIEDSVGGELLVNDVLFVSASKIPRIRRRLNIPERISSYQQRLNPVGGIFRDASTYAWIMNSRKEDDRGISRERRRIQKAIWLLSSSLFARYDRGRFKIGMKPSARGGLVESALIFDPRNRKGQVFREQMAPLEDYRYGRRETQYLRHHFFPDILKLLRARNGLKRKWFCSIRRAAALAGRSYMCDRLSEAFLLGMIAIEMLLSERGDRFPDAIICRINSLFGWLTDSGYTEWREIVKRLYGLRCDYVHEGADSKINGIDLYNADEILKNLLCNICRRPYRFNSKQDLVKHEREVEARRDLGIKPFTRKDRFTFTNRILSSDDETREREASWSWE